LSEDRLKDRPDIPDDMRYSPGSATNSRDTWDSLLVSENPMVQKKADQLVEAFLKPTFIKPLPADTQSSYIVDIYTNWYRGYFYFCSKYRCPALNCISEFFEDKFAWPDTLETENSTSPACGILSSGWKSFRILR
jgi:hypothetical protein